MHFGEPRARRHAAVVNRSVPLSVALALALVLATAACGGGDDDEPTTATGRFGQLHDGVCAATQFSEAGDRKRAEDAFDDVHFGLHSLVQAVEQEDRATAARLLEAIEATEREGTSTTLHELTERVAEGIERTGGTAPDTCP